MNYKVITNESLLKDFISWLPSLRENEIYYLCLFARNKYCKHVKHISSDKSQLKRFTANKNNMFDKIKQLEIELDCYYQVKNGIKISIPQEALALYVTVNPRDIIKATYESIKHLTNCLQKNNIGFNPYQEVLSKIQQSYSRKIYLDLDFDIEKEKFTDTKNKIESFINKSCLTFLETRGGFHCLIELSKINPEYKTTWYKNITSLEGIDMNSDNMIPVVGTYQGGFTPKFVE